MKVKKLEWYQMQSQFSIIWRSHIKFTECGYTIWIERESGKTKVSSIDRQQLLFNSIEEAKLWCQNNFNEFINFYLQ